MKTIKYLVAGLLLASLSVPAMAQTSQADIDAITKVIVDAKGDAVATKDQVKEFKKAHKKDAVALAALGRAFLEAKNYQMAEEIANLAIKANAKSAEGYILLGDILHDFLCRILHNDSSFSFLKNEKDVCKRVKGCLCETSLFELL